MLVCLVMAGLLIFPSCLWADAQPKEDTLKVEFSEIGPLVEIHNLAVDEAKDGVEDAEEARKDGIKAIDAAIDGLNKLGLALLNTPSNPEDPASPPIPPAAYDNVQNQILYALLDGQKQSLLQQRSSLIAIDVDKLEIQRDMAIDTITSSLETVYITYNSLGRQLELLNAQKELADAQVAALELQEDLGMVTAVVVNKTKNEIKTLENSIKQLERTRQTLKEQFNLALSYEFDEPLEIGEVPQVMRSKIVTTDVERDYKNAWENSYEVLLNEDESSKREADVLRKFRQGFYNAYQTMRDKQDVLELENAKLALAEKDYEIAQRKHEVGIISDLQLATEKNNYLSQQIKVELTKDEVFQAYHAYEWANRGLIVSTGSSASGGPSF